MNSDINTEIDISISTSVWTIEVVVDKWTKEEIKNDIIKIVFKSDIITIVFYLRQLLTTPLINFDKIMNSNAEFNNTIHSSGDMINFELINQYNESISISINKIEIAPLFTYLKEISTKWQQI